MSHIKTLVDSVRQCCEEYGAVVDIVARRSLRKRGQAFVVFDTADAAQRALRALKDKELYGKPMRVALAKQKSYATLARQDPLELEALQRRRQSRQKRTASSMSSKNNNPAKRQRVEVEQPNNILFLQGLPESCTREVLLEKFHGFPGFVDVRLFAARGVGFVEFKSDNQAAAGRQLNLELGGKPISISYAKR